MRGLLGPGLGVTVAIGTAPATLQPDQAGGTAETGQVPDVDPPAFVGQSPDPTARTTHDVSRRLDADPQLVGELGDLQHPELDSPNSASARPVASSISQRSPSLVSSNNSNDCGTSGRVRGWSRRATPYSTRRARNGRSYPPHTPKVWTARREAALHRQDRAITVSVPANRGTPLSVVKVPTRVARRKQNSEWPKSGHPCNSGLHLATRQYRRFHRQR